MHGYDCFRSLRISIEQVEGMYQETSILKRKMTCVCFQVPWLSFQAYRGWNSEFSVTFKIRNAIIYNFNVYLHDCVHYQVSQMETTRIVQYNTPSYGTWIKSCINLFVASKILKLANEQPPFAVITRQIISGSHCWGF